MQVILNWHSTVKWQKMSKWYFRNSGKTYYLPLYCKSLLQHYPWITEFYCSFQYDYFDTKIKKGISITESLLQVGPAPRRQQWNIENVRKPEKWNLVLNSCIFAFLCENPSHITVYKGHILQGNDQNATEAFLFWYRKL